MNGENIRDVDGKTYLSVFGDDSDVGHHSNLPDFYHGFNTIERSGYFLVREKMLVENKNTFCFDQLDGFIHINSIVYKVLSRFVIML